MNKFELIKEAFMKDFWWKVLSLAIAIALWFIVINIENPTESRNYTVPLEIRNSSLVTDKGLIISNYNDINNMKVNVKIRGQRISLDRLFQNRDKIQAYVDISSIDDKDVFYGENSLYVNIKLPSDAGDGFEIESKSPNSIIVRIEKSVEKSFPIELVIDGNGDIENSSYKNAEITPSTVTVRGTQSLIDSVVGVKAVIRIESVKEDMNYTADIIPYDKNGMEVIGINISDETANIYIPMKASKKVRLIPSVSGIPKDGMFYESVTCTPEEVYVIGDENTLRSINEIQLPPVNISGKEGDLEAGYAIKYILPSGVKLKEGEPDRVVVNIKMGKEALRDVVLKYENITYTSELPDGLIAEVVPTDINLQIKGPEEIVAAILDDDIKGNLTIPLLEEGEYRLPISVSVPEGIRLTEGESPYITIIVKKTDKQEEQQ